jgi:hypothetical protein
MLTGIDRPTTALLAALGRAKSRRFSAGYEADFAEGAAE